jgi:hypothetical protein
MLKGFILLGLLISAIPCRAQQSEGANIVERYIDLNNLTMVFTKPVTISDLAPNLVGSNPWYTFKMTVYYSYKNKRPSNSKTYGITFNSTSKKRMFEYDSPRELTVYADGEKVVHDTMQLREFSIGGKPANEIIDLEISQKAFEKLTKASIVKMQLGKNVFALVHDDIRILQDLSSYLAKQLGR